MAFDRDKWRLAEDFGTRPATPTALERHAWTLVAAVGLVLVVTSLWAPIVGLLEASLASTSIPTVFDGHRYLIASYGLLVVGLAIGPLRRQERWAWALLLAVPATMLGIAAENHAVDGTPWQAQLVLGLLAAAGLLLWAWWFVKADRS